MEGITVHIGWEYFLGLLGTLVAVAWYSNGRFTALETELAPVVWTAPRWI
ncbi:hypothetical protein M2210_006372 [Bradyrhizobium elkanii]|nr:hypothetical protein [Bradyrhizobium elkanii]